MDLLVRFGAMEINPFPRKQSNHRSFKFEENKNTADKLNTLINSNEIRLKLESKLLTFLDSVRQAFLEICSPKYEHIHEAE